jgi:hypothetical protein
MSQKSIAPDATIAHVVPTLGNPEEYVRQVLGTLYGVQREHGEVVVRVGLTGKGHCPNYRVDAAATSTAIDAFDGQSHRPFTDVKTIETQNWSTSSMTLEEVALLRKTLGDAKKTRSSTVRSFPRR